MSSRLILIHACVISCLLIGCDGSTTSKSEAPNSESTPTAASSQQSGNTPPTSTVDGQTGVDSLIQQGIQALAAGDLTQASRNANQALLKDPENGQAMALAGQVALRRGDTDDGIELLRSAADAWPEQSASLMTQAVRVLWQAERMDEAQQGFIELLKKHPGQDDARRGLAELFNRRGFRYDANQQIRVLCARPGVQPTIDELRCLIVPSRAYQAFTEKPDVNDQKLIDSMGELSVARALFGEGDVREALQVLELGKLVASGNAAATAFYGQVLLESQQYQRFETWLAAAKPQCRRYPAYWVAMGGWALRQQQPTIAARLFGEAIRREPGDLIAHDRMHQALKAANENEAAARFDARRKQLQTITKMTRIIFSNPNINPDTYLDLADVLEQSGRPLEAKCWRSLSGYKKGFGFQAMHEADRALRELLTKESQTQAANERLCGVDLSKFPLDLDKLMTRDSTGSSIAQEQSQSKSTIATPPPATPVFVNVAQDAGIDFRYENASPPKARYFLMHEAVGSGIACLDFDSDGRVDFYVGQGACNAPDGRGSKPNLLARNIGGEFQDVIQWSDADDRGYTLGVTSGDWNQDGFVDLVVGNMTRNRLLINQGDGTFRTHGTLQNAASGSTETPHVDPAELSSELSSEQYATGDPLWDNGKYTSSLAIADVTGDHIPDMVEVTYLDDPKMYEPLEFGDNGIPIRFPGPLHFQSLPDRIFTGLGNGEFTGSILETSSPSPGLGLLITDIDRQGGNDIFVANDMKANHFWIRQTSDSSKDRSPDSPQFIDAAVARGLAFGTGGAAMACMGIAAADFDENGFLDIHITNFADQWTNQYMQTEENLFDDQTLPFGLDSSTHKMLGFGTEALDFDNNGTIDLVTGNGHIDDLSHEGKPFEMPTQFFIGDRHSLTQTNVTGDPAYWNSNHLTRGLVTLDWNSDGKIDFATSDLKEPLALLENKTQTDYHWIQLELIGTHCERDAIGAIVTVHVNDGRRITQSVQTGDGYMSRNQSLLHFGLGQATAVDQIEIRWPDESTQTIGSIDLDHRYLMIQEAKPFQR